jgi:hypothetical protein
MVSPNSLVNNLPTIEPCIKDPDADKDRESSIPIPTLAYGSRNLRFLKLKRRLARPPNGWKGHHRRKESLNQWQAWH